MNAFVNLKDDGINKKTRRIAAGFWVFSCKILVPTFPVIGFQLMLTQEFFRIPLHLNR